VAYGHDTRRIEMPVMFESLTWGELKRIVEAVDGLTDDTPIEYIDDEFFHRRKGRSIDVTARLVNGRLVVD
jgi:hypothetical protein